jgi:hypothetical protein
MMLKIGLNYSNYQLVVLFLTEGSAGSSSYVNDVINKNLRDIIWSRIKRDWCA